MSESVSLPLQDIGGDIFEKILDLQRKYTN